MSRVTALAAAGGVFVSATTHELVADSDLRFEDRGTHELKGVTASPGWLCSPTGEDDRKRPRWRDRGRQEVLRCGRA